MILIWYVWYDAGYEGGTKDDDLRLCKVHIKYSSVKDVFRLTYTRMRKYGGKWHLESQPMFPGYVFLESREEISDNHAGFFRVYPEEEQFFLQLFGAGHHLEMSRGFIRDGVPYVTEGPLMGCEQMIRKIDRHKRLAKLKTSLLSRPADVWTGLEIVSKD